jgi:hypothetical protein
MRDNLLSLCREEFEKLCQALLREEYPKLQPFSAPDKGMDAYDPDSHTIFQVYFPERNPRTDKVAADLKKADKGPRPCEHWVLLLPKDPTPSFMDWIENKQKPHHPFGIAVWGSTEIHRLLRNHPTVRKDGDGASSRHLEDIKAKVLTPIRQWLESSVVPALKGNRSMVSFQRVPKQKIGVPLGESSTEFSNEIVATLPSNPAAGNPLFDDARDEHFPEQLSAFKKLEVRLAQFLSDLATLTRSAADRIASATSLPRMTAAKAQGGKFADSDNLACLLLRDLLANRQTDFRFGPGHGLVELKTTSGGTFARGEKEAVTAWYEAGREIIRKSWEESDLAKELRDILPKAIEVSEMINELELTYDLRGDCHYVCE